jgi:hypothetical protein
MRVRIGGPVFTVGVYPPPESEVRRELGSETGKEGEGGKEEKFSKAGSDSEGKADVRDGDDNGDSGNEKTQPSPPEDSSTQDTNDNNSDNSRKKPNRTADPLRWFGILTPLPLRQAQSHAIQAVEDIIPRLATLSAEMARVELEVRRARKRRAKAEKVEGRKKLVELEEGVKRVDVGA